jgi:hypothetical protein
MNTYKFLARDAMGPLSGFHWPAPGAGTAGAWVQAEGPLELCVNGTHVCRAGDLAHWLHDELWVTEIDGEQLEGIDCLLARRARLVRRIDGWQNGGSARFAEACADHATALADQAQPDTAVAVSGFLDDARLAARTGFVAVSAYSSALAVARLGAPSAQDGLYRQERAWQSAWIARMVIGS